MNKIAGRSASLLGTCYFCLVWNPIMTLGSVHLVILIEQNHWKNRDNSKKKIFPWLLLTASHADTWFAFSFGGVVVFPFWISRMVPSRKTKAIFCFEISYNWGVWSKCRFLKANAYNNFGCPHTWLSSSFILQNCWCPRPVPTLCQVSRASHCTF